MTPNAPDLFIKQIAIGPMMNFAYLVGARGGSSAILIDPSWDADALIKAATDEGRTIEALLLTHTHFDHANAVDKAAEKLGVPVYVHEAEAKELPKGMDVRTTKEKSTIDAAGLTITCLHTPGHTPGSQCFMANGALFTGDTLFVEGCGRVDLDGGSPEDMVMSLVRLGQLPGDTVVYPGHDYGSKNTTTIDEQRRTNPYMNERAQTLM